MKSSGFIALTFRKAIYLIKGKSGSDLHLNRYFLYTLLPTGFFIQLGFQRWQRHTLLQFLVKRWLVRIANVYGFMRWLFRNIFSATKRKLELIESTLGLQLKGQSLLRMLVLNLIRKLQLQLQ